MDKNKAKVPGIVEFRVNDLRHVRCDYCFKYPHIVKQHINKNPRAITTLNGTRYFGRVLTNHLETLYHKECAKSHRISLVVSGDAAPMDIAINQANKTQIDRIGKLMIQVYLDAKRLNLPPHTWPSRYVAGEASFAYESLNQSQSIIPPNIDLQYVNKPGHLNLMSAIVTSHREEFLQKINDCIAISLRIDGSVDFTRIDKIYIMAKLINLDGSAELVFIGIGEQTERGATGLN